MYEVTFWFESTNPQLTVFELELKLGNKLRATMDPIESTVPEHPLPGRSLNCQLD